MPRKLVVLGLLGVVAGMPLGCDTAPQTHSERQSLVDDSNASVMSMEASDPSLKVFLNNAYGYVIFPSVGKGAVGVGGAYGHGVVYEHGRMIGYADITQGTVGVSLGGQEYRELICFEDSLALDKFKANQLEFAAQASAVAVKAGASTDARYDKGVVVFTMPTGGLMFEAAIGGQRFTYVTRSDAGS